MQVPSTGQPQNMSASGVASASLAENFNAFLTLLTTQLKNQDPTEPMNSQEFVGQLVQFSQVEQAIRSNQSLEKLIDLQNTSQISAALGYIGSQVEITSDIAALVNGKAEFSYTLPEKAGASTRLHTVPGGDHGGFTLEQNLEAMRVVREFLQEHGIIRGASTSNE